MTEELTASCTVDLSSYLPSYKWANWKERWRLPVLVLIPCGSLLYLLWLLSQGGKIVLRDIAPFLMLALVGGFAIYRLLSFKAEYIRQLKLAPWYGQKAVWVIKADGYEERVDGSHLFTAWDDVNESKKTPDGVMVLLRGKAAFNWIPRVAFSDATDYQRFLEILKAKTKHSTVG